jgi:hypothetical protein
VYLGRSEAIEYQFRERSVSTTDIDPSQSRTGFQPIKKDIAGEPAPNSHHPFIAGRVIEANLLFCHWQTPFQLAFPGSGFVIRP